jgi:hypothetical protein
VNRIAPVALAAAFAAGCSYSRQLHYDHGRAIEQAMNTQADLTRPSAANQAYPLSGAAGLELRQRVQEVSTDQESGTPEAVKSIGVQ